jgi:hypothetical protein
MGILIVGRKIIEMILKENFYTTFEDFQNYLQYFRAKIFPSNQFPIYLETFLIAPMHNAKISATSAT